LMSVYLLLPTIELCTVCEGRSKVKAININDIYLDSKEFLYKLSSYDTDEDMVDCPVCHGFGCLMRY
jgi:RecJ-like exonuclease